MEKIVLFILISFGITFAADLPKCDTCAINKEYVKCSYYVEKKADLSKQESCLIFAHSLEGGNSFGRASWYYLLGGDFDNAIKTAKKSLKIKEYYAAEYLAEAFMLKGDEENAKKHFLLLNKKVPGSAIFIDKHFEILNRLYPKKFNMETAKRFYEN